MTPSKAADRIENLCERLEPSDDGLRYALPGTISRGEYEALQLALIALTSLGDADIAVPALAPPRASERPKNRLVPIELVTTALAVEPDDDYIACLDFGTAFSKAGVRNLALNDGFIDLPLGRIAGEINHIYPVSSSIFFDGAQILFGAKAVSQSLLSGQPRLDSIKRYISEMVEQVERQKIDPALNRSDYDFTVRDGVLLYLAYLTDLLGDALDGAGCPRYAARRYTLPGLDSRSARQGAAVDSLMKRLLAEAQILADTFRGRWLDGLSAAEAYSACRAVEALAGLPTQLVREGLPEALAASQAAVERTANRALMLVVDVGAGTSDVGAFVVQPGAEGPVVGEMANSMKVLRQAGDCVDEALVDLILTKANAPSGSQTQAIIQADLKLKAREYKERLLASYGEVMPILLANDGSVDVTAAELESHRSVKGFLSELRKTLTESLGQLDESSIRALNGRCRVVLTGGGSRLPALRAVCNETIMVNGSGINLSIVNSSPSWLSNRAADFIDVFDQMAVAAGGCEAPEDLVRAGRKISSYAGGTAPRRVIETVYKA